MRDYCGSSRILDIPCGVCGDYSSGKHYNIFACDGCAGFFKRSIRRNRQYVCKAKEEGSCIIDKSRRNQCRACRLQKCQEAGMNRDAVQHERGPRSSTLRRFHLSQIFQGGRQRRMDTPSVGVADMAVSKDSPLRSGGYETRYGYGTNMGYFFNPMLAMPVPMALPMPHLMPPPTIEPSIICESAAKLLLMNVRWARSIPAFTELPFADQLLLLEESWRDLFILAFSQLMSVVDLSPLLYTPGYRAPGEDLPILLLKTQELMDIVMKVRHFQLDSQEMSCLRAMVLFKTSFDQPGPSNSPHVETRVLSEAAKVTSIQDETQLVLKNYISSVYPGQAFRFDKLLLLLPLLTHVSSDTIEQLFFRKAVGNTPITVIINDMYKSMSNVDS